MKLKRAYLIAIVSISTVLIVLGILYYRATIPFQTTRQFVHYIHAHRLNEAKQMIDPRDSDQLTDEYWNRLEETEFDEDDGWLMSYTMSTLLRSRISFIIEGDMTIRFTAEGRNIRIREQ